MTGWHLAPSLHPTLIATVMAILIDGVAGSMCSQFSYIFEVFPHGDSAASQAPRQDQWPTAYPPQPFPPPKREDSHCTIPGQAGQKGPDTKAASAPICILLTNEVRQASRFGCADSQTRLISSRCFSLSFAMPTKFDHQHDPRTLAGRCEKKRSWTTKCAEYHHSNNENFALICGTCQSIVRRAEDSIQLAPGGVRRVMSGRV